MSDRQYLLQRHQAWYVKVTIPPSARHLYGGKTHIIRSLKTREISQAKFLRHQVVADIKAEFLAAKGNAIKAAAVKWQKKIAAKNFDASEFTEEVRKLQKVKGDAVAEEYVNRTFKLHTDLNHLEEKWFAHGALVERTKTHYRYTRRLLAEHLKREGLPVAIESVTETIAGSFRDHLIALGTHRTTANSLIGGLRSRFNYWINIAKILPPPNPFRGVNIPTPKRGEAKSRRAWNSNELITLFTGDAEQGLFDIMAMLICSGMRRGELLDLKGEHCSPDWVEIGRGKTDNAPRRVPVAEILKPGFARLLAGIGPDDYVFARQDSNVSEVTRGNRAGQRFLRYREGLGLTDSKTVLHSLRHWFISIAEDSQQRHNVQAVVGHARKKETTDDYSPASDRRKKKVVEAVTDYYLETDTDESGEQVVTRIEPLPPQVKAAIKARFGKA